MFPFFDAGSNVTTCVDVVNTIAYSTWTGGPVTIDHENIIKAYSLSPSMLGRGQTILEPDGPAWVRIMDVLCSPSS